MTGHVLIVGSINVDISVTCVGLPQPGETVLADSVHRSGGGKGANQAIGAARAGGAPTVMIGAVGEDGDGDDMIEALTSAGVDCARGARLLRRGGSELVVSAPNVEAVDTVAAGDTFCGVLAAALARGGSDVDAIRLGSAAASLAVQRRGAQSSVPTADETRVRAASTYGAGTAQRVEVPHG